MSEMQEKTELLQDIQASINHVESGNVIEHEDAKLEILNRIKKRTVQKKAGVVKSYETETGEPPKAVPGSELKQKRRY